MLDRLASIKDVVCYAITTIRTLYNMVSEVTDHLLLQGLLDGKKTRR